MLIGRRKAPRDAMRLFPIARRQMGLLVKEVQIKASAKMIVTSVSMPTPSVNPISLFSLRRRMTMRASRLRRSPKGEGGEFDRLNYEIMKRFNRREVRR